MTEPVSHLLNHNFIYRNALTRFRFTTALHPDLSLGLNLARLQPKYTYRFSESAVFGFVSLITNT